MSARQHAITALVQNEAGTINRLVSNFRRRGFSIDSFNAGDCEQKGYSRLTLLLNADDSQVDFALRQLDRLVDVVEVEDLMSEDRVMREVVLVSLDASKATPDVLSKLKLDLGAQIEHQDEKSVVLQFTGPVRLVESFLKEVEPLNPIEIVRSGPCALKISR